MFSDNRIAHPSNGDSSDHVHSSLESPLDRVKWSTQLPFLAVHLHPRACGDSVRSHLSQEPINRLMIVPGVPVALSVLVEERPL